MQSQVHVAYLPANKSIIWKVNFFNWDNNRRGEFISYDIKKILVAFTEETARVVVIIKACYNAYQSKIEGKIMVGYIKKATHGWLRWKCHFDWMVAPTARTPIYFVLDVSLTNFCTFQGRICALNCLITCEKMKRYPLVHACKMNLKSQANTGASSQTHNIHRYIHIHYIETNKVSIWWNSTNWWLDVF